jgi:hypothetical protein
LDHKNLRTAESKAMLGIVMRRNKPTVFERYGKLVEPGKLRRFLDRQKKKDPSFSIDMRGMFRQLTCSSNRMG